MSTNKALIPTPVDPPKSKLDPEINNRILVVEDEPTVASAYVDILAPSPNLPTSAPRSSRQKPNPNTQPDRQPTSFVVQVAHSAQEALRLWTEARAKGEPFAVGFFDVMLGGGMDGIELVRQILKEDKQIFAVLVTAYQDRSVDAIQGVLGVEVADRWDYLNKPFSQGEILQKARSATRLWNLQRQNNEKSEALQVAQERLLESERAASIAAVARGVGHEFGNILHQIMGRAELTIGKNESESQKALETILMATEKAAKILERFKDLSSPVADEGEKVWMPIQKPIDEALMLVGHQLARGSVQSRLVVDAGVHILGNPTSLVQVFVNLFINALHAMPNGGRLEITGRKQAGEAEILVRDTGSGVPQELMDKVMQPFFTTKGKLGTGLGLSICKEVIEIEHAGEFEVRNHSDGGAEFVIRIPVKETCDE